MCYFAPEHLSYDFNSYHIKFVIAYENRQQRISMDFDISLMLNHLSCIPKKIV